MVINVIYNLRYIKKYHIRGVLIMSKLSISRGMVAFVFSLSVTFVILIGIPIKDSAAKSKENPDFGSAVFNNPLTIDNTFMPLVVGTTYVYMSETQDGTEEDTVTVTSGSEMLGGVNCRAVSDVVTLTNDVLDHVPVEETTDWYAQDDDGNIWYCGEDTVEHMYDDMGHFIGDSTEGSWNANEPGAEPGIVMLAHPRTGNSYRQEFLEGVAEDMAKVLRLNAKVSIEMGDFEDCLKTKEWSPLEKGVVEHKYYAEGIGLVLVEELKGKTVREELVDIIP